MAARWQNDQHSLLYLETDRGCGRQPICNHPSLLSLKRFSPSNAEEWVGVGGGHISPGDFTIAVLLLIVFDHRYTFVDHFNSTLQWEELPTVKDFLVDWNYMPSSILRRREPRYGIDAACNISIRVVTWHQFKRTEPFFLGSFCFKGASRMELLWWLSLLSNGNVFCVPFRSSANALGVRYIDTRINMLDDFTIRGLHILGNYKFQVCGINNSSQTCPCFVIFHFVWGNPDSPAASVI